MKTIYFSFASLIIHAVCFSQGGWTKVIDSPIATFSVPGVYKGAAWVDINNDGNTDLFAMPRTVFLNKGNGVFTELTNLNIWRPN